MRRKKKTIVKIGRLLNLKRFICKKAQFVDSRQTACQAETRQTGHSSRHAAGAGSENGVILVFFSS